uniref:Uncharacterized protein n=1 Tax=Arundo donax TaxID=35708 RepID=A0A0A9FWN1_ARUDO
MDRVLNSPHFHLPSDHCFLCACR